MSTEDYQVWLCKIVIPKGVQVQGGTAAAVAALSALERAGTPTVHHFESYSEVGHASLRPRQKTEVKGVIERKRQLSRRRLMVQVAYRTKPTVLWHATTPKMYERYLQTGHIQAPVRGFDTQEACIRWAAGLTNPRTRLVRIALKPYAPVFPLPDHHMVEGTAWWTPADVGLGCFIEDDNV